MRENARSRSTVRRLAVLRDEALACRRCAGVVGPPVIGPPVASAIYAIGQAPGPHEGARGYPFAHTAGKQLFAWLRTIGVDEATYRERVYMAAVARCFPGKGRGASKGDRVPSADEIATCATYVARELEILRPRLIVPIGRVAIAEVLGERTVALEQVIGQVRRAHYHGHEADVIALPHPSGLSAWPKVEPGKTLLARALALLAAHRAWRETFAGTGSGGANGRNHRE